MLLEPGATQIVRFTITVPEDARSGDHVAGILVERAVDSTGPDTDNSDGQPQFAVNVVQRVGVAVVIAGRGEVMVDGTDTLTISDRQNNELASIPFEVDTVLAKDPTFYYIDYPIVLADGDYLLTSVAQYRALREDDTVHTTTLSGIELIIVNGQPKIPATPRSPNLLALKQCKGQR